MKNMKKIKKKMDLEYEEKQKEMNKKYEIILNNLQSQKL